MSEGFAIEYNGYIDVRTVSPTQQTAKVNGLGLYYDTIVTPLHTPENIDELWRIRDTLKPHVFPVELIAVNIEKQIN